MAISVKYRYFFKHLLIIVLKICVTFFNLTGSIVVLSIEISTSAALRSELVHADWNDNRPVTAATPREYHESLTLDDTANGGKG